MRDIVLFAIACAFIALAAGLLIASLQAPRNVSTFSKGFHPEINNPDVPRGGLDV